MKRSEAKKFIQDSIEKRFLHKYSNLDKYDIKGTIEREIRNDAENCADKLIDDLVEELLMLPPYGGSFPEDVWQSGEFEWDEE